MSGTIGEGLDRLETLVGRIGMNSPAQAQAILNGLNVLSARMAELENPASQKPLVVQQQALLARLRSEAVAFLRDLGGSAVLQALRVSSKPPIENSWWYLDDWLAKRRQASRRSLLRVLGAAIVIFVLLAVVYQRFLAPSPEVMARLEHEQNGRDALMAGNVQDALVEIDQGLQYDAQNLDLLILKGVALQTAGRADEAGPVFDQAAAVAESQEAFLLGRAQAYLQVNNLELAMADVQSVLAANPQSPSGYLLSGQIHEARQDYLQAYDDYDKASSLANAQDQIELAAIARTRLAYLVQIMNSPQQDLTVPAP